MKMWMIYTNDAGNIVLCIYVQNWKVINNYCSTLDLQIYLK